MSLMRMPFTVLGQWVTGLTVVAFVIATTGCGGLTLPTLGNGGSGSGGSFGTIVNTDITKDLIGGVRMSSGEAVYVFGQFNSDGTVADVTLAVYQNASGQEAKLFLESGRLTQVVGFDGSTVDFSYTEVSVQRIAGTATYTPVSGSPAAVNFDIDLQQTADQVAALVQNLTGMQISTDAPPSDQSAASAKTTGGISAKAEVRSEQAIIVVVLVPIFMAITGYAIVLAVSQIMETFVLAEEELMIAVLTPFIVMGDLMRAAVGLPVITIQYGSPDVNFDIPRPS